MKKSLLFLLFALVGLTTFSQVYNPSLHATVNKSLGMAQAGPTDARSYFFDENFFVYRPFTSTSEVLSYLTLPKYRTGQFDIIVNTGGSVSNGVITGGTNTVWYFKDGTADGNLVLKGSSAISWGAIIGTLSNQTDLVTALNGKVNTSLTLTINNVTQSLAANRTWTIPTIQSIDATNLLTPVSDSAFEFGGTATKTTTAVWGQYSFVNTFNSLNGTGFDISSNYTGAGSQILVNALLSGAHSNSGVTTTAIRGENIHTGTSSVNYGVYGSATGGATNYGVYGNSDATGVGVRANNSGSGLGIQSNSASGSAIWGIGNTGNAAVIATNQGTGFAFSGTTSGITATAAPGAVLQLVATSTGTAANGFGGYVSYVAETSTNTSGAELAQLKWTWFDATNASRSGQVAIALVNNGAAAADKLLLLPTGQFRLHGYGANTFTGTLARVAGFTSNGTMIEVDPATLTGGGGGTGDVVGPASATDNALARFDLTTGKLIQNSNATLNDAGDLAVTGALSVGAAATFSSSVTATGNVLGSQLYALGAGAGAFVQDQANSRYFHIFRTGDLSKIGGQNSGGTYVYPLQINSASATDGALQILAAGAVKLGAYTTGILHSDADGDITSSAVLASEVSAGTFGSGDYNIAGELTITKTTEPLRIAYDGSNYMTVVPAFSGSTTFDLTGTTPTFTFGKTVNVTGSLITSGGSIQNATTNTSATFYAANQFTTTSNAGIAFSTSTQVKARAWFNGSSSVALATNDGYAGVVIGNTGAAVGASAGTHAFGASLVVKAFTFTPNATTPAAMTRAAAILVDGAPTGATNNYGIFSYAKFGFDATVTAGGTTGNQTINKPSGTVNFAAGTSTITVTNSLVTTSSIVYCVVRTADATAKIRNVVPGSGSFVITLDAAATAETSVGFIAYN